MSQITVVQALQMGQQHHAAGRLGEAEQIYRQVLAGQPKHAGALHLLALLARDTGHLDDAVSLLKRSIAAQPSHDGHLTLAFVLHEMGRLEEALASYQAGLRLNPKNVAAQSNLADLLNHFGQPEEAAAACLAAIGVKPDFPPPYNNLGNALRAMGRLEEAIESYCTAARLEPKFSDAHLNLGHALMEAARPGEAVEAFRAAAESASGDATRALSSLGVALARMRLSKEAEQIFRDLIAAHPEHGPHYNNLGIVLGDMGRDEEALAVLRRATELTPEDAQAWSNLGNALVATSALDDAADAYRAAIQRAPDLADAYNNLGHVLKDTLRQAEAVEAYRQATRLRPDSPDIASNLVYGLHFLADIDPKAMFEEHRAYAARFTPPQPSFPDLIASPPDKWPLRIGFVSGDLRDHPVGRFMLPLFRHHDREANEFICFAQWSAAEEDDVTRQLRALADGWHEIISLSDHEAAELIRSQQIDILIDLAGHTAHNRLPIFALKPAPVQATYLGYPNTTGLPTIDFRLTDALADPRDADGEALCTERLIRLPETAWCYEPPADAPDVAPLPAISAGHVTFGSFNNLAKVNAALIELWSQVLLAVPGSRLVIKATSLRDPATRSRLQAAFAAHGVESNRIEPIGSVPSAAEHLGLYGRIDIALDTFPYHGTTTTCEALWMGVPVVTLAGRTHASRVGVSLLSNIGLRFLATTDRSQYIAAAASLAADRHRLAELRATLRDRMLRSPLMAAPAFARRFECALRDMLIAL